MKRDLCNYFIDVNRNKKKQISLLRHGFEMIQPNATISVDLDLEDLQTAIFLEILYYT